MKPSIASLVVLVLILVLLASWGCSESGCMMGQCGDGVVDKFEQCDDGNFENEDGCNIDCEFEVDTGLPPTLASVQSAIFDEHCTSCHYPGGTGLMPLTAEFAYDNLVNVGSLLCSVVRVKPFEPDNSCIVLKVEDSSLASGNRMPPPSEGAGLDQDLKDLLRAWILDGAQP